MVHTQQPEPQRLLSEADAWFTSWALGEYAGYLALMPANYKRAQRIAAQLDPETYEACNDAPRMGQRERTTMVVEQIVRSMVEGAVHAGDDPVPYLTRIRNLLSVEIDKIAEDAKPCA